jgi:hypothetical protein
MLSGNETQIASSFYQVRNGGGIAALFGISKVLIEADDILQQSGASRVAGDDAIRSRHRTLRRSPSRHRSRRQIARISSITISSSSMPPASKNSPPPRAAIHGRNSKTSPA